MALDLQAIFGEPSTQTLTTEPDRPEALHPETKHGGDRKSDKSSGQNGHLKSFSEDTAQQTGKSRRTVETPSPDDEPHASDPEPSGIDPTKWIRQPDATGRWGWQRVDFDADEWPDFDELPSPEPCPVCGSLELWEPMAADPCGSEPAEWRCMNCDPPTKSRAAATRAAKLRRNPTILENRATDGPEDEPQATGPTYETSDDSGPYSSVYGPVKGR